MVEETVAFVDAHPDCCERSLLQGHMTGSAWILDRDFRRVLLTHHRKLNRWLQPGGHADGEADILGVALREAREESGLLSICIVESVPFDVDIHVIPARGQEPEHKHYDVRFLFQADGNEAFHVSEESHALAWVSLQDLATRVDINESVRRMVRKTLKRRLPEGALPYVNLA